MDEDESMSDASSDASGMSADEAGTCDSCGSWGLTPDSPPGSGFNVCQICQGRFCNCCSMMCPGGCDKEFCSDCAPVALVHYLPGSGKLLHRPVEFVEGDEFCHDAEAAVEQLYYSSLAPFCSSDCVHTFSVQHAQAIDEANADLANTHAQMLTRVTFDKCKTWLKFLLKLGLFNSAKRMAAAEAAYTPGGKGHKRSRDEFEGMAAAEAENTNNLSCMQCVHGLLTC